LELEQWELLSYVVTVVGFPFAIIVYILDQRRERQNEEEEVYQRLSDEYAEFSKLLLENADLQLMSSHLHAQELTPEQKERKKILFEILVALFERAFILVYEEHMSKQTQRLWASWDDYIRLWCARPDFRGDLDYLLSGEDPDFVQYMRKVVSEMAENKKPSAS